MSIVQVADPHSFAPFPVSTFVSEGADPGLRLEDWARQHHDDWAAGEIFVIDAKFSFFGMEGENFAGIKLLKILRLLGHRQHCILYSFLTLPQLLASGKFNSILLSAGTSYVRLPGPISEGLCLEKLDALCEEDVVPFFNSEAIEWLGTRRHSLANWWGVLRLHEVLQGCGLVRKPIPQGLQRILLNDSSYQGLLMNLIRFNGLRPGLSLTKSEVKSLKEDVKALWDREVKVVYVDDQAGEGWAYLLQMILYGAERPDLFTVPQLSRDGIDVERLAGEVYDAAPDLIILDMRLELNDETAAPEDLSGIRLIRRLVQGLSVTCPILAFTASDKRVIYEKALELGADGVWTKEGIDESSKIPAGDYSRFSLSRVQALISQLSRLTGYEYSVLYDCLKRTKALGSAQRSFWWQGARWYLGDKEKRTPVAREKVVNELMQLFHSHKQFLLAAQPAVQELSYDMLTVKLCRMMEIFHPSSVDENGKFITLGKAADTWGRDMIASSYAQFLVMERNNIVHVDSNFGSLGSDVYRYKRAFDVFFDYLTLQDPSAGVGTMVGTLRRSKDENGQLLYSIASGMHIGHFKPADFRNCEVILKGQDSCEGAEAVIKNVSHLYPLGRISYEKRPGEGNASFWTADARIGGSGPWGANLLLFHIRPRDGVNFLLQGKWSPVNPGTRVYFHIKWYDGEKGAHCSIFNIEANPPEATRHTFWSGVVTTTGKAPGGVCVQLDDIAPPFNAVFRMWAGAIPFIKENMGGGRVCFLPMWTQEWELASPRYRGTLRVYINAVLLREGTAGEAMDIVRTLAKKYELYLIGAFSVDGSPDWPETVSWVSCQLGREWVQRLILCSRYDLLKGDILIERKDSNGAEAFEGSWIPFGNDHYPDWETVRDYLVSELE